VAATALTILAVLVLLATHEGWNVWRIGGSHRWAAGAILVLGMGTCALGSPDKSTAAKLLGTLGTLALGLALIALVTGSLIALSLLVVDFVLLWAVSTFRHGLHAPQAPVAH
jgi:hypothetical protein